MRNTWLNSKCIFKEIKYFHTSEENILSSVFVRQLYSCMEMDFRSEMACGRVCVCVCEICSHKDYTCHLSFIIVSFKRGFRCNENVLP
jgi:hypothetical protein